MDDRLGLPPAGAWGSDCLPEEYRRSHRFGGRSAARAAEIRCLRRQIDAAAGRLVQRLAASRTTQLRTVRKPGQISGTAQDGILAQEMGATLLHLRNVGLVLLAESDRISERDMTR